MIRGPVSTTDELAAELAEMKRKLEAATTEHRFELLPQQAIELSYICQRIDFYLKVYGGERQSTARK